MTFFTARSSTFFLSKEKPSTWGSTWRRLVIFNTINTRDVWYNFFQTTTTLHTHTHIHHNLYLNVNKKLFVTILHVTAQQTVKDYNNSEIQVSDVGTIPNQHKPKIMGLIHETLVGLNLRTDLHIIAYSTNNPLKIQEHVKLCSGNSDLMVNMVVDHKYQTIVNWQHAPGNQLFA